MNTTKWTNELRLELVGRILNGETYKSAGRDYGIGQNQARMVFLMSLSKAYYIHCEANTKGAEVLKVRDIKVLRTLKDQVYSHVESALMNEPKKWHDGISTFTRNVLKAEFGRDVVDDKDALLREIQGVNLLKIPNMGKKGLEELGAALGIDFVSDISGKGGKFDASRADECKSYLESWGYKVCPPE